MSKRTIFLKDIRTILRGVSLVKRSWRMALPELRRAIYELMTNRTKFTMLTGQEKKTLLSFLKESPLYDEYVCVNCNKVTVVHTCLQGLCDMCCVDNCHEDIHP